MAIIRGTDRNERLGGTADPDTIYGLGGNDSIFAKRGADTVFAGRGADRVFGELGDDVIHGGDDADLLTGGRGNDRVFAGAGSGDEINDGAEGADGSDFYDGGAGIHDEVSFIAQAQGVSLTLGGEGVLTRARQGAETDLVRNIEDVTGSQGADRIVGNDVQNMIAGSGGGDRLEGRGGSDLIFMQSDAADAPSFADGGAGNDTVVGGQGIDLLYGGVGRDIIDAGRDPLSAPQRGDIIDPGRDGDTDQINVSIVNDPQTDIVFGIGVDRVVNFFGGDQLDIELIKDDGLIQAAEHLDTDGNRLIDGDDADVRQVGQDLVVDLDAMFGRVIGTSLGMGEQHVVLVDVTSFDVDQLL